MFCASFYRGAYMPVHHSKKIILGLVLSLSSCSSGVGLPVNASTVRSNSARATHRVKVAHLDTIQGFIKTAYTRNFHVHDTNKDRQLSLAEYVPSFQKLPVQVPEDKIAEIFARRDLNQNGALEENEFVGDAAEHRDIALRLQASARKLFSSIDLDKNQRVTRTEVTLMGVAEALEHFDRFVVTGSDLRAVDFENLMAYVVLIEGFSF